jgi:adenylate cyclase
LIGDRVERRLAPVLAADVAGCSRLMGRDEERTLAQLKAFRKALIGPTIAAASSRRPEEFAGAVDAARCAVEVQRSMAEQIAGVPHDSRIEFASAFTLAIRDPSGWLSRAASWP